LDRRSQKKRATASKKPHAYPQVGPIIVCADRLSGEVRTIVCLGGNRLDPGCRSVSARWM